MSETDSNAPRPLEPSQPPNPSNKPRGYPTEVKNPNPQNYQQGEQARAHRRENESAADLSREGYDVEQNPPLSPGGKRPDYRIEGEYVDCLAPNTNKVGSIYSRIQEKIDDYQVDRVVVNMDDSPVEIEELQLMLVEYPIFGLKEVIILKGHRIVGRAVFP